MILNGLPWKWRNHFVFFEIAPKYCISDSLLDFEGYSVSSKELLPTIVNIMVIWIKSSIPIHFDSLIPKMSTFTLAMPCLSTSNLPLFMDLTFHVPMLYCSLQYQTLLSLLDTSTTVLFFYFGSASSFLLELFLCSSSTAYWTPTDLRISFFSVISFCPFKLFTGF